MKSSANRTAHLEWADGLVQNSTVSKANSTTPYSKSFFNAYSAELDDDAVSQLVRSDDVEWVEEDGVVHTQKIQCVLCSLPRCSGVSD